jgi:hypothetical protein
MLSGTDFTKSLTHSLMIFEAADPWTETSVSCSWGLPVCGRSGLYVFLHSLSNKALLPTPALRSRFASLTMQGVEILHYLSLPDFPKMARSKVKS